MGTFLLLILFFVIFAPLAKAFWSIFRQVRQVRRFMNDPAEYFNQAAGRQKSGQTHHAPVRRKKKFAKDVGEYIEYEEIKVSETSSETSGSTVSYKEEDQVSDIKWKDL